MNNIKLVLLDLDGTIYNGDVLIDGAKEAIETLQEKNIPFIFLTNNASIGHLDYYNKLTSFGFKVKKDQFITPVDVLLNYLEKQDLKVKVYGTSYLSEVTKKYQAANPSLLVIGTYWNFNYLDLKKICMEISEKKTYAITNPDQYISSSNGFNPDVGAVVEYIYAVTKIKPSINFGKPNELMGQFVMEKFHVERSQILMIGDLLETDIEFAKKNDFQNALVLTGCKKNPLEIDQYKPQFVFGHILDAIYHFFK